MYSIDDFKKALKESSLRNRAGLAKETGLSEATVSRILGRKMKLTKESYDKLVEALGAQLVLVSDRSSQFVDANNYYGCDLSRFVKIVRAMPEHLLREQVEKVLPVVCKWAASLNDDDLTNGVLESLFSSAEKIPAVKNK